MTFYTHRGVNQPPYIRGFPMNLVFIFGGLFMAVLIVCLIISMGIGNYMFGIIFTITALAISSYYAYRFLMRVGPFGVQKKIYMKYFYQIDKIVGGRPKLIKIKLS